MPPCADMSCAVAADSVAARSAARADARAIVTPGENHDTRTWSNRRPSAGGETPVARASPRPTAEARGRDEENARARDAARVGRAAGCGAASARRRRPRASRRDTQPRTRRFRVEESRGGDEKTIWRFLCGRRLVCANRDRGVVAPENEARVSAIFAVCAATVYPTV